MSEVGHLVAGVDHHLCWLMTKGSHVNGLGSSAAASRELVRGAAAEVPVVLLVLAF